MAAEQASGGLAEIVALTPEQALHRLSQGAPPGPRITAAADEAEKLLISDLKRGLEAATALVAVADLAAAPLARARTRRALAQGLAYANRFDEALGVLREAVALAESAGDSLEAARARMTTLHALARLGRHGEAIEAGQAARAAFVAAAEPLLAARADINLGVVRRMRDEPAIAIEHFERARPAILDQPMLLAQMESNRAEALLDLNRFDEAREAFSQALGAFRRAGAARAAGIVEGNLADLAARQGRFDTALEHFELARRQLGQTDAPGDVARLRAEQAEALAALGLFGEAAEQFRAAVPVLAAHKLAWESARARAGLAASLLRLGQDREAGVVLEESVNAFESLGHATGAARVRVLQAELARRSGDLPRAESLLAAAIPPLRDRPALCAMARLQHASTRVRAGAGPDALAEIDAGLEEARRLGLAPLVADFLELRAQARLEAGDRQGHLADLEAAAEQVDRVRGTLRADRFRAAFLGDHASLFARLVTATLDAPGPDRLERAFEAAERARSRSLLDVLQAGSFARDAPRAADDDERALLDEMSRLRAEMNALYASLDDGLSRPRTAHDARAWSREVECRERQTGEVERRLSAAGRYAHVFSRPQTLSGVRASLAHDQACVCYVQEGEALSAFVLRAGEAHARRHIASCEKVNELLAAFHFQVARAIARALPEGPSGARLRADAERDLAALHALLLAPLAQDLTGASRLVVVPHAQLHSVPFGALVGPDGPLVLTTDVVLSPSASVWTHLNARPGAAADGPMAVVGVADQLAPQAENEARALCSIPGSIPLLGPQATISRFKELAPTAAVIHVASHARFSPGDPLNSGLKLADGWLTAREVAGLRLSNPTVILSGCDTGRSEIGRGDEIWGLVRAFLVAGASTLIISLWPAHDRIAAETMAAFHADWYSGRRGGRPGTAAALRRAQADLVHRGLHPGAWANFVVIGKP